MTGDANGDREIWPNQEIYRNSQISDYFKIPPFGDWGSRGPGFKSRQPDSKMQVRGNAARPAGVESRHPREIRARYGVGSPVKFRFMLDSVAPAPA
jgi:hypothetical protein